MAKKKLSSSRTTKTVDISKIGVVAELERMSWVWEPDQGDHVKAICPFHNDTHPSCSINTVKRVFRCHACRTDGDFITFMAKAIGVPRATIVGDMVERYGDADVAPISSNYIERAHAALFSAEVMMNELKRRGMKVATMRQYRLGFDQGRITIPIPNEEGAIVNVRKYLPGAPPSEKKMLNMKGRGGVMRLFPLDQLKYDQVVILGGEVKAMVTAQEMNRFGVGAITSTGGEGNWDVRFNKRFRGKTVWICMDVDEAGRKAREDLCAILQRDVEAIYPLDLDLDTERYPKGDINDYFGPEGRTAEDFVALLESADRWVPRVRQTLEESEPIQLPLSQIAHAQYAGVRVSTKAVVRSIDLTPYLVPKKVRCGCDKNQPNCAQCPVFAGEGDKEGFVTATISSESPGLMGLMNSPKGVQRDNIRESLGIPECNDVEFIIDEHYALEDARISPQIDMASTAIDREMMPCVIVGEGVEMNASYEMTGRVHPHPRDQRAVFLASRFDPTDDALSSYQATDEELESLRIFQPKAWTKQAVDAKLNEIYADFSANVTRIYERRDLHMMADLAFHSPLSITFDGKEGVKGWVEIAIVGDSSQGKTETVMSMSKHYGVGEKVDCKNASVAGLLGGLQASGNNRFFVSWGVIPTHDRRLVILEELKGASREVIGKLTDMRSSGVAEIPKIEKRRTRARTRLIAMSNPRSGMPMSSYSFGVEAIMELLGAAEDVRRFDACMIVAASQVDATKINALQRKRPIVPHVYTSEACRRCVLWAWTRTPDQVSFEDDAYVEVMDGTTALCSQFAETIPLVDAGSMRFKIARLSASIAARTASTEDLRTLIVRKCHVEVVIDFLNRIYSDPACGYSDYSRAILQQQRIVDPKTIKRELLATPFPSDLVENILSNDKIELRDLCDWCSWDRGEALELLSMLVRKRAFQRVDNHYRKTPGFIALLRELRVSQELATAEKTVKMTEGMDEV